MRKQIHSKNKAIQIMASPKNYKKNSGETYVIGFESPN